MTKEIDLKMLEKFEEAFDHSNINYLAMNAANKNGVKACINDYETERRLRYSFSIDIEAGDITNQKQSGRCWMFAALNTMRIETMKKLNLKNMELSQNYILFYDKLEKANYFLENIIETITEPLSGRTVSFLLKDPLGDGGQWDMLANLIRKYGVVPKETMPETFDSSATAEIDNWMTKKLREFAKQIRIKYETEKNLEIIRNLKDDMLQTIYRMLCISLGKPPKQFTWEVRDKDDKFIRVKDITPQQFYQEYIGINLNDYVSIINAPTEDKAFFKSYTIKHLGNVKEGHIVRHLNLPIEDMKNLAISQLKEGRVVWFGCDVGQFHERDYGAMDVDSIRPDALFSTEFGMDKAERLDYGESLMTHAMVFTGVNLDDSEKPDRWKVENSWGEDKGNKGFYIMSDEWFSEYMYQIVIHRKYLKEEWQKAYDSEPIELEPWDPMGSLA